MSGTEKSIKIRSQEYLEKLDTLQEYAELKKENNRLVQYYYILSERQYNLGNVKKAEYFKKKSEQIKSCANTILKAVDKRTTPPEEHYYSFFCHNRLCPVCIAKLSKQIFKLVLDIVNHPNAKNYSYLFITLTIKNCKPEELSTTIDKLLSSYTKLINTNRSQFAKRFKGTFRVLESTYNYKNKTYHPHLHVLVMIDKSYFKEAKKYLTKDKLIEVWQKALDVDYRPSVDIRKTYDATAKTVAEVSKYTVKSSEVTNADILEVYDTAFKGRRLRSFTGDFKTIKKEVLEQWKTENTNSVSYKEVMTDNNFIKNLYKWDLFSGSFKLLESNKDIKEMQKETYISNLADIALADETDYTELENY